MATPARQSFRFRRLIKNIHFIVTSSKSTIIFKQPEIWLKYIKTTSNDRYVPSSKSYLTTRTMNNQTTGSIIPSIQLSISLSMYLSRTL